MNSITGMRHRNSIQQRIVAASNQRCGEYKKFLKAMDARTNLFLGTLTTAFAGAGAIFTGANTARALSGIAGIISGSRAEFNQGYFANQTIQVLTEAFYKRRRAIQKSMIQKGKQNLFDYPVERAIADAVRYHENCSLIAGLEVAALAVTRVDNPGANQLKQFHKITRGLALEADTTAAVRAESAADGEARFLKAAREKAKQNVDSAQKAVDATTASTTERTEAENSLTAAEAALKKLQAEENEANKYLANRKARTDALLDRLKIEETGAKPSKTETTVTDSVEKNEKSELNLNGEKKTKIAKDTDKNGNSAKNDKKVAGNEAGKTIKVETKPLLEPDKKK